MDDIESPQWAQPVLLSASKNPIHIMRTPFYVILPLLFGFIACSKQGNETEGQSVPVERERSLRLVSSQISSTPILGEMVVDLAKNINQLGGNDLSVKVYDPGKLVEALEVLDAVSAGKVEAGFGAGGFWMGKIPSAPLFSAIPFGPNVNEYIAWFYGGNGMKLYQEMYDTHGFNVKVLVAGIIPPESSGWFAHEIQSLDDLKGLKMRFYGLGGEVMKQFGVAVRLLPPGEIFPALEKGVIDATEFSMPSIDERLGFHKIVNYNYFPGWHQQATAFELLVNKEVWNSLSDRQRSILEIASRANVVTAIAKGESSQGPTLQRNAERGVQQRTWSPEMLEQFQKTWDEVARDRSAEDPFFKKVWDDLRQFRQEFKEWGDQAYLD